MAWALRRAWRPAAAAAPVLGCRGGRRFVGEVAEGEQSVASAPLAGTSSVQPPAVGRYGTEDGVVHLNVGGQKFVTLRSTLEQSSVLREMLQRTEANPALAPDGVIFVDRDPATFSILLNHMRNKAEGLEGFTCRSDCAVFYNMRLKIPAQVQLPKDTAKLRDLYIEAEHFDLADLQGRIEKMYKWSTFLSSTKGNPIDAAASAMRTARTVLVFAGGLTASAAAVVQQLRAAQTREEFFSVAQQAVTSSFKPT